MITLYQYGNRPTQARTGAGVQRGGTPRANEEDLACMSRGLPSGFWISLRSMRSARSRRGAEAQDALAAVTAQARLDELDARRLSAHLEALERIRHA